MAKLPVVILSSDADTQDLYVYALRRSRRAVYGLFTVEEVFALSVHTEFESIVVDVRDKDDWRSCRLLRWSESTRQAPVVVLTGFMVPRRRFRDFTVGMGCAAFIAKPARPEVLLDVLNRVANGERHIEEVGTL